MITKLTKLILISICIILPSTNQEFQYFPDDISGLDYITYNNNEWLLGAFYYTDPNQTLPSVKYDYRNGITIYPYNDCLSSSTTPTAISAIENNGLTNSSFDIVWTPNDTSLWTSLAGQVSNSNCETLWTSSALITSTVVPALQTLVQNNIYSTMTSSGDLICAFPLASNMSNGSSLSTSLLSDSNYRVSYYTWMSAADTCNSSQTYYNCCLDGACTDYTNGYSSQCSNSNTWTKPVFYQEIFDIAPNANSKWDLIAGTSCTDCDKYTGSDKIYASVVGTGSGADTCTARLHYLKVTLRKTTATYTYTCNPATANDCPPEQYCSSTNSCSNCPLECRTCDNTPSCTSCSRFSHEWKSGTSSCTLEYIALTTFTPALLFTGVPPIKTGRATVAFWLYIDDVSQLSTKVAHIVVEDQMVVSLAFPSSHNVKVYCTAHHLYHSKQTTNLENITTRAGYETAIADVGMIYSTSNISSTIDSISQRWFYVRCAVNYHSNDYYVMTSYNKSYPYTGTNSCSKNNVSTGTIPFEKILGTQKTDFHFSKFYRQSETISIKLKNFNSLQSGSQVFMKNLYVWADYIPAEMNRLQYFNIHKIVGNQEYPEFIFAAPFDEYNASTKALSYYVNPYAAGTASTLVFTPAQVSFHLYPMNLYRLNLLSQANVQWSSRDVDPTLTSVVSCTANALYCFDADKAFVCNTGYYLNISTFTCGTSCPSGYMIGRGLGTSKGYCQKICIGTGCNITGINTLTCSAGYTKIFDKCMASPDSETYSFAKERGGLYYNSFFNLPPLYINLATIHAAFDLTDYYLEFFWLYETASSLRPSDTTNYFFLTNAFGLYHNALATSFSIKDNSGAVVAITASLLNLNNWNKFTFKVLSDGTGKLWVNNQYDILISFAATSLQYILFCHADSACQAGNTIKWSGGWYKNFRIWDAKSFSINDKMVNNYQVYDNQYKQQILTRKVTPLTTRPAYIALAFKFHIDQISNNIFSDSVSSYSINLNTATASLNSYNTDILPAYNFSTMFDIITLTAQPLKLMNSSGAISCHTDCQSCWGEANTTCNTVNPSQGYYLNSKTTAYPTTNKNYYVFISPLLSNEDLAFANANLKKVTVTFFIKIIGFTDMPVSDVIRFSSNLKLRFDHATKKLELFRSGTGSAVIASFDNFNTYFGSYVFISLAYSYDSAKPYFPGMMNLQVDKTNLVINQTNLSENDIPTITIPKSLFAMIAKLNIYNNYLIGAYGYETNLYYKTNAPLVTPYKTLISSTSSTCINTSDLSPVLDVNNIICYVNYDPLLNTDNYPTTVFTSTANPSYYYVVAADGTSTNNNACSSTNQICYETCYGATTSQCSCRNDSTNYWIVSNSDANKCVTPEYLDFARFGTTTINNVKASKEGYSLEFWVFIYNYSTANINLSSYDIAWDKQLRMSISYTNPNLQVSCYPAYDASSSLNYINQKTSVNVYDHTWTYVRCSADRSSNKYFVNSNSNLNMILKDFTLYPTTVTSPTTLTFKDNTVSSSWGLLLFRQIRLWGCFTCFSTMNYLKEIKLTYAAYFNLYHIFDPTFNSDFTITDLTGTATAVNASTRANFFGYNVIDQTKYSVHSLCDEFSTCNPLAKVSDFENMEFSNIPVSNLGRYTLEMWTLVTDVTKLSKGYNVVWRNHVALSLIANDTSGLKIACFPLAYLNTPEGKNGSTLQTFITSLVNVDSKEIVSPNGVWVWIRCAVSWDLKSFYLYANGTNASKTLQGETLYSGQTSDYPFRFFFPITSKSSLLFENAATNTIGTDVYIRNVYLFEEYLPPAFTFKYSLLTKVTNDYMPHLLCAVDMLDLSIYERELIYYTKASKYMSTTVTLSADRVPSYDDSLSIVQLCDVTANKFFNSATCADITTCSANAPYCSEDNKAISCKNNYFLNPNTATCDSNCPNDLIRSPGSSNTRAICNFTCSANHNNCSFTVDQMKNYQLNLTCKTEFTRVGYSCLSTETQNDSIMNFNRCYNFPSVYNSFTPFFNQQTSQGYILEFWFKLDRVNEFCADVAIGTKKYLFYSYPHSFYIMAGDSKMTLKYQNLSDRFFYGVLKNFNPNEWNCLLIQVKYSNVTSLYSVDVLSNMVFSPIDISRITEFDQNIKGFAFCSGNGICNPGGKGKIDIVWSAAFYKNIRIYSSDVSIFTVIDNISGNVNGNIKEIMLYYQLSTPNLDLNIIKNNISKYSNNIEISSDGIFDSSDKNILFNSSANVDWGAISANSGKFVANITPSTGTVTSEPCDKNCKRCLSSFSSQCYVCNAGYFLYNGICKTSAQYYLRVPPAAKTFTRLKLIDSYNNKDISQEPVITLTFWIKYWGQTAESNSQCPVIIRLNEDKDSFICYEVLSKRLLFYYQTNNLVFEDNNFSNFNGQWTFIAVSNIYAAKNDLYKYFPNMTNFYVMNKDHQREANFFIPSPGLQVTNVDLGYEILALFADVRFYKNYIIHPFALLNKGEARSDLILQMSLTGTSSSDCLSNNNLISGNVSALGITCVADNIPYMEPSKKCSTQDSYLDNTVILRTGVPSCAQCDSRCTNIKSSCSGSSKLQCMCNFNSTSLWLRQDAKENLTYCDQPPYVDFSQFESVTVPGLKLATDEGYTIEFWTYIYSYNEISYGFSSFEIIWDHHLKVTLFNDNNKLKVKCNPIYSSRVPNLSLETAIDPDLVFYQWTYIQCSTSIKYAKYYVNTQALQNLVNIKGYSMTSASGGSSLALQIPIDSKTNFGFIFFREIKLWSLFNLREISTECAPQFPAKVSNLLHYFPLITKEQQMDDVIQGVLATFKMHSDFLGYNIIDKSNTKKIDQIPFELDKCSYLSVTPKMGYYQTTNFLIKCSDANSSSKRKYKYYYSISESSASGSPSKLPITDIIDKSEINYKFNSTDLYGDFFKVNLYCEIIDAAAGTKTTSFERIELYLNNLGGEASLKDTVTGLYNFNSFITEDALLSVATTLGSLAENNYKSVKLNRTKVTGGSNIHIQNPECSPEFCNNRGDCFLIDRMLTCVCKSGYGGFNCQVTEDNGKFLIDNFEYTWKLLTNSGNFTFLNKTLSTKRLSAISWLVSGATNFPNDQIVIDQFLDLAAFASENIPYSISENLELWIDNFDKIFTRYQMVVNQYKIQNYQSSQSSKNGSRILQSSTIERNVTLNYKQKQSLYTTMNKIKTGIETLINTHLANDKTKLNSTIKTEIDKQYYSYDIIIKTIDRFFNMTDYLQSRLKNYDGFFDCDDCFYYYFNKYGTMQMIFIYYRINPFVFNDEIYSQSGSFLSTLFFADSKGGKINLTNLYSPMQIYFPLDTYNTSLVDYLNSNKFLFFANNSFEVNDPLATAPVYVFPNGTVSNLTQAERIKKFHRQFNIVCKYFNKEGEIFESEGVNFANLINNFVVCNTTHFSDFNIFIEENIVTYTLEGPFFYLNYPQVFMCLDNYFGNKCFLLMAGMFFLLVLTLLLLIYLDYKKFKQEALLDFIKYQVLKDRRRYLDEIEIYREFVFLHQLMPEIFQEGINIDMQEMHTKKEDDVREVKNISYKGEHVELRDEVESPQNSPKKENREDKLFLKENKYNQNNKYETNKPEDSMRLEVINIADVTYTENFSKGRIQLNNYALKDSQKEADEVSHSASSKRPINENNSNNTQSNPNLDNSFNNKNPSCFKFLCKNLLIRNIYISPFVRRDSFNPRYKKLIILFNMLIIMLFINTLVYTSLGFFDLIDLIPANITLVNMIIYSIVVAFGGNLVILFIIPLFRVNPRKKEDLYNFIVKGCQLGVLYEWEKMRHFNKRISIIGFVVNGVFMIVALYFTLNYCSILVSMQMNLIMGWGAAVFIDALVLETLVEVLCVMLFLCRNVRFISCLFTLVNSHRNFKALL